MIYRLNDYNQNMFVSDLFIFGYYSI